jgi:hypothetical protein
MRRDLNPASLIAIAVVSIGGSRPVAACSCGWNPSVTEALAQAEAAFEGVPSELGLDYVRHERVTTFTVCHVFKGVVPARFRIVSALEESACGYSFVRGSAYVVFTRAVSGRAFTSQCAGNRALAVGQPIPPELGAGSALATLAH